MVNAGRILIMPRGDWNSQDTFEMLDLVSYNSVAYLARQQSVGVNPATDTSYTYWQPFGSASSIATPTTPGLVMPDSETILVDASGEISIPIDNSTIIVDQTTRKLKAAVNSALSTLTDVQIASAINGQALIYDSSAQKWKNANITATGVTYTNTTSGLSATTVQGAIDEVEGRLDTAETAITTNNTAQNNKHKVTSTQIDTTGWTSDTTSQSGTTLYKKTIALSHVYVESPSVDIGAGTGYVLPTSAEQESYNLIQYVTVDDTVPCLYLYASEIPTTAFYIKVTGVD